MQSGRNSFLFLSLALLLFFSAAQSYAAEAAAPRCTAVLFDVSSSSARTGFRDLFELYGQQNPSFQPTLIKEELVLRQETIRMLTLAPESMPQELKVPAIKPSDSDLELAMKPILIAVLSKKFPDKRASNLAARMFKLRQVLAFEDVTVVSESLSYRRFMKIRTTQLLQILAIQDRLHLTSDELIREFNQTVVNFNYDSKRYQNASLEEQDYRMYEAFIHNLENRTRVH